MAALKLYEDKGSVGKDLKIYIAQAGRDGDCLRKNEEHSR